MFSNSSSLSYACSGVTALSVVPLGANQNGCLLCMSSNIGKQVKTGRQFLPTEACRFAAWSWLAMFCWNVGSLKLKCSVEAFQFHWCSSQSQVVFALKHASQRCFYILPAWFWHTPGQHGYSEAWLFNGELNIWVSLIHPGCSSVLSGERLLHSGYVRASKSPLARAWESEEVRWGPCLPPESPAGRMGDPGVGGSSVVLLIQCGGMGIFPG